MVKVIVLKFVCYALAAFATAKPLSHEESPKPETNNIVETQTQLRSLKVILGELHQAIGTILEHIAMYDQKRFNDDSCRQTNCIQEYGKINTVTINSYDRYGQTYCIGNGNGNINTVTVNNYCHY